jgi:hypothetical protein
MANAAPTPTQTRHVSRPIPTGLVPVAVLVAAAAGLLALLPSLAQAVWEVPHLFLLGAVISFGVFTQSQRNNDADGSGNGNGNAASAKDSPLAWNARYHPDDEPLVVVEDHAVPRGDDDDDGLEGARERPLSLPVRRLKLKPAAASRSQGSETGSGGDASDGFGEETDSCASSSGFWAGARAVPSPPSVLDAQLGLSPRSLQPESEERPFFVQHSASKSRGCSAATPAPGAPTVSRGFVQWCHPSVPGDKQPLSDDGEVTDWDEDADGSSDEMTAAVSSERSVPGDVASCASDCNDGDGDDTSVDEELLKLAAKAEPDREEEVDRKADEFIAKFREQIRLQRH